MYLDGYEFVASDYPHAIVLNKIDLLVVYRLWELTRKTSQHSCLEICMRNVCLSFNMFMSPPLHIWRIVNRPAAGCIQFVANGGETVIA
jgi:hypothetical protein